MKICVAQAKSVKGDIERNITSHKKLIDLAVSFGAEIILFPELSLTGYEPALAKNLAIHTDDNRLNEFQEISDVKEITIGVGIPTKTQKGVCISMVLFQPDGERQLYSKKYLHTDEEPFFISGQNLNDLKIGETSIALAICYELSVPEHTENAFKNGAKIYIASVAKSELGIENATITLSGIAKKYKATVLMANCTGPSDDFISAGKTSAWNDKGLLIGQLNETDEGILIYDTVTRETIEKVAE